MVDERGARAIPYRDILAVFDDVQFNTHNFIKQNDFYNDRYRHSFVVVGPTTRQVALDALKKQYKRK